VAAFDHVEGRDCGGVVRDEDTSDGEAVEPGEYGAPHRHGSFSKPEHNGTGEVGEVEGLASDLEEVAAAVEGAADGDLGINGIEGSFRNP
jgi:hypothetical protein